MSLTDLGRIEDAVWNRWTGVIRAGRVRGWWFTATGLACGAVVVAVIRAIVALGAGSGNWWARVPALLSAVVVLAVVTALMLRWYLRHRADEDDLFPVLSAVVLSIVAAGLTVVTFAGLATVIWDAGYASPPPRVGAAEYALVERSYLWTLAGSVPVLALPGRFGWADPLPLAGVAPDLVRLGCQFMLLVPLIRVAQAGYAAAKARWLRSYDRQAATVDLVSQDLAARRDWTGTPTISAGVAAERPSSPLPWRQPRFEGPDLTAGGQLAVAVLAVAAVVGSSSLLRLAVLVHGWWHPGAVGLMAAWAARVLPWLLAAWLVRRWLWVIPRRGGDLIGLPLTTVTVVSIAWIAQIIAAAASVLALLAWGGVITVTPAGGETTLLLEVLAWRAADALPGPGIPAAMHWTDPGALHGSAAALVVVAVLLSVVAVLAFPVGRALHVWSQRAGQWRDPDRQDPQRAPQAARSTATADLRAADQAVRDLAALVTRERLLWYWVHQYMGYPWVRGARRPALPLRGGLTARLFPRERRLSAAVSATERALIRLQDSRAELEAAGAGPVELTAYDAAAAAVRRHYLHLDADDPEGSPAAGEPPGTAGEELARVSARAAAAADGFAATCDPPAGPEHRPWQDAPVTLLAGRLTAVPVPELLETVTSESFRLRWDFTARVPLVLAEVATRPARETAAFLIGLLAAERGDLSERANAARGSGLRTAYRLEWPRKPERAPAATRHLLALISDQGEQRVAEVVAALLAYPRPAEAPVAGRGSAGDPARYCAGLLVRPYYGKPVRDAVRLALLLDEAGSAGFAIDRLLRNRLQSARDLVDALDILREAGRDDLRPRVLALAAQWEEDSSFLSSGIWVSEIIRLLRFLRADNVSPAEFLLPLGQNRKWSASQRERVIAELRQTPLDESQWLPLL
jgi:hypothetical protein